MSAALRIPPSLAQQAGENAFLSWFAGKGHPIQERKLSLGGFSYFQFSAAFHAGERAIASHGRSEVRKIAALKCAGECVERQFVAEYFRKSADADLPPKGFRTTNGWAVHQEAQAAKEAAYREALERHLHLKSFFTYGWAGFRLVDKIEASEVTLYFLTSRFTAEGLIAGLVVAKSPLYAGVAFGYCVGQLNGESQTAFWESGIYEALDKILALKGEPVNTSRNPNSWILAELKHYLENPFDLALLELGRAQVAESCLATPGKILSFDLAKASGLNFPLHAAHVAGGDLIPLFSKPRLATQDLDYLAPVLEKNGISKLPERHPVI